MLKQTMYFFVAVCTTPRMARWQRKAISCKGVNVFIEKQKIADKRNIFLTDDIFCRS